MKDPSCIDLLSSAKSIRRALIDVKPKRIAVAYVGEAWRRFLASGTLQEVVLSPTFGSNPKAIEELMQELGPKNVHFLDNLHAKFYIGDRLAMVGSNNLSANGFSDNGLRETAVLLQNQRVRAELIATFERYKLAAKDAYPNQASKLAQLRKLKRQWDLACWQGLAKESRATPPISEYNSSLDRIHIAWFSSHELSYNKDRIYAAVPSSTGDSPDDYFGQDLAFLEEDDVQVGDWIIQWRCNQNGMPARNGDVRWMQVHYVVPHGFEDDGDGYTKFVAEADPTILQPSAQPFRLDKTTKSLVRTILASLEFPELLSLDDESWRLAPADRVTGRFISRLRQLSRTPA